MTIVTERCELTIREGMEADFGAKMDAEGRTLLLSIDGVRSVRFGFGVENPGKFLLLIEWRDLAAHEAFAGDAKQAELRALLAPFTTAGAMEHFVLG